MATGKSCLDEMKIAEFKNIANLIRSNTTYNVYDYKQLKKLTLSLTELHPRHSTTGHSHKQEEVYVFVKGYGTIDLDGIPQSCAEGDAIVIPKGVFHKVHNTSRRDLKFWCIFERYER